MSKSISLMVKNKLLCKLIFQQNVLPCQGI